VRTEWENIVEGSRDRALKAIRECTDVELLHAAYNCGGPPWKLRALRHRWEELQGHQTLARQLKGRKGT
jgi:hypothetical protein